MRKRRLGQTRAIEPEMIFQRSKEGGRFGQRGFGQLGLVGAQKEQPLCIARLAQLIGLGGSAEERFTMGQRLAGFGQEIDGETGGGIFQQQLIGGAQLRQGGGSNGRRWPQQIAKGGFKMGQRRGIVTGAQRQPA